MTMHPTARRRFTALSFAQTPARHPARQPLGSTGRSALAVAVADPASVALSVWTSEDEARSKRSLALPASEPMLVERVLVGTVALAALAAIAEAIRLMLRLAATWEGFNDWAARLLF